MKLVDYYYLEMCGYYPKEEDYKKTTKVIRYLKDANINSKDILDFICSCGKHDFLTFDMLPDTLWENSILKKNVFYYHNLLHITSKPPKWNAETNKIEKSKFYLEMKITFNETNIIDYFYSSLDIDKSLCNLKSDIGAVKFLLDKYKKFAFIEPVDFVLFLIDYAKDNNNINRTTSILQLSQNEVEVFEKLKRKVDNARFQENNKIVWR